MDEDDENRVDDDDYDDNHRQVLRQEHSANNVIVDNLDARSDIDDDDGNETIAPQQQQQQQHSYITSSIIASVASGVDYGYTSRSEGCRSEAIKKQTSSQSSTDARFDGYGPPGNIFTLGSQQFMRNLRAMIGEYTDETNNPTILTSYQRELQSQLHLLTLNSTAIWERERQRGPIIAPYLIKIPYYALCYLLDIVFEGRNVFSRFFLLETVARMPYFSYITMLHLYETLGFWRRSADIKRIHFAEEWNEFHHLLIMESYGGDQQFWVRFLAQHSALAYYLVLCILWMLSPSLSYKFSEMLETHAVDTYGQFIDENETLLKGLPPSLVALEYYTIGLTDPMFGEYQTASVMDPQLSGGGVRKSGTNMQSLYDVMVAIRNDESDHVHTMANCLDPKVAVLSPALEGRVLTGIALTTGSSLLLGASGLVGGGVMELNSIESMANMADGLSDLDSVLAEDNGIFNAAVGGLAGLANGISELFGTEAEIIDDDVSGSTLENIATGGLDGFELDTLENIATGGLDGFELESIIELVRNIILSIIEIIGIGL
jgi:ubiquinol oxidase